MMRISPVLLLLAATALSGSASAASIFLPGNLVVSVEGNGSNTGAYATNQAAPLTLYAFSHNGTLSATLTGSMALPQNDSGANHAISGEYGSSSEGGLQLTGDGQHLVIAGYGVNADTFNANPALYGPLDPTKPNALAQSSSSLVPRVIAVIGADGSVDTTTALTNVFNGNNPRSVASQNGTSFYISGQGNNPAAGPDSTGGVFFATLGANSATPITGNDTVKSKTDSTPAAQDTRIVHIVNGQLYVSVDSKEGTGSNRDYIGTLGSGLPTGLTGGPVQLSNFATSNAGKQAITFATGNGINVASPGGSLNVNLSPEDFFFADANTLYVADSGNPKNDSQNTIGDGGLQKWSLIAGKWTLDYTLADGLGLVANTHTCLVGGVATPCGTSGLLGLTGQVVGGQVQLFATNYTLGETDQTYLFGISDALASLAKPVGESFTTLAIAPADTTFKGVAFAPQAAVPEPAAYALMITGFGLIGGVMRRRRFAALA
jgi:hypothetical protein